MLAPMVKLRPSQFFKLSRSYEARRPLLSSLPAHPVRIIVEDNADGTVGCAAPNGVDPSWHAVNLYVRRLGWEATNRDAEYLALWVQVRHGAMRAALPGRARGARQSRLKRCLKRRGAAPHWAHPRPVSHRDRTPSPPRASSTASTCTTGATRRSSPSTPTRVRTCARAGGRGARRARTGSRVTRACRHAPRARAGDGLRCRALVLPTARPGNFRISFERLQGAHAAFHELYRSLRAHLSNA